MIEDNAVSTYEHGIYVRGKTMMVNNAAIKIRNDMYSMFHDMGAIGMSLRVVAPGRIMQFAESIYRSTRWATSGA